MNLICLKFSTYTTNCARSLKTSQKMCKYKLGRKETFDARMEIIGRCTCNKFENISNPHYRNKTMVLVEYLHVTKNKCKGHERKFKILRCMIYVYDIVVDSLKELTPIFLDLKFKDLKIVGAIKALWCTQKGITI